MFGDHETTPGLYLRYTDNSHSDLEILVEEVIHGLEESHFINAVEE